MCTATSPSPVWNFSRLSSKYAGHAHFLSRPPCFEGNIDGNGGSDPNAALKYNEHLSGTTETIPGIIPSMQARHESNNRNAQRRVALGPLCLCALHPHAHSKVQQMRNNDNRYRHTATTRPPLCNLPEQDIMVHTEIGQDMFLWRERLFNVFLEEAQKTTFSKPTSRICGPLGVNKHVGLVASPLSLFLCFRSRHVVPTHPPHAPNWLASADAPVPGPFP